MDATFTIKQNDFNETFFQSLKSLYGNARKLEITITEIDDFEFQKNESPEAYLNRLQNEATYVNQGGKLVSFTPEQMQLQAND